MKFLCSASPMNGGLSNEMFKSLLEEAGIPGLIRYEQLSVAAGEVPFVPPELWILNDEDYDKAKEIVDAWQNAKVETHAPWVCAECGETIEGQFTSCWKCGKEREECRPVIQAQSTTSLPQPQLPPLRPGA